MNNSAPLAVIIQGNPKYLNDPKIAPLAISFYEQVEHLLEARGYRVEFDPGKEYTIPNEKAAVWVAHSRGIDRLRFAPKGVKTLALETQDHGRHYNNRDAQGMAPEHYRLSAEDIRRLKAL